MTPSEFYDLLEQHDWYYAYSDSSVVYQDGVSSERRLVNLAIVDPVLSKMYSDYYDYMWSHGSKPKPERP